MLYGIDVSHHQDPAKLDWSGMRSAGCDLCIVRLTYGTHKDSRAKDHIAAARENGFVVGAYAFVRAVERVADQYIAFAEAADEAGYGLPEDLVPTVDIEDDTDARPLVPSHAPIFEKFCLYLKSWKNTQIYAYITARDWARLGKPGWVLQLPLFVAHYAAPSRLEPATPNGMPWCIWQHRVGPFQIHGPSGYDKAKPLLDQSRARRLFFLNGEDIVYEKDGDEEVRKAPDDDGTAELRAGRRALIAEATEAAEASRQELLASERAFRSTLDTLDEDLPSDIDPEGTIS